MKVALDSPDVITETDRDPVLWDSQNTDMQRRLVLICPHIQFAAMFQDFLLEVDPNIDVDEINDTALPKHPYIDVHKREESKKFPTYIIDFGWLNHGDTMVQFPGYAVWALEKYRSGIKDHMYFQTAGRLDQAIEMQAKQRGGKMGRYDFDAGAFAEQMKKDARTLLGGDLSELDLFHNVIEGLEQLVDRHISDWKEGED